MARIWYCPACDRPQRIDREHLGEFHGDPDDFRACRNVDCSRSREARISRLSAIQPTAVAPDVTYTSYARVKR